MSGAARARPALLALVAGGVLLGAGVWLSTPAPSRFDVRVRRLAGAGSPSIPLARISPFLRQAVVATEDERFYRHHGIDVIGILRAVPFDVSHLSLSEGASTITEQLAKRLYLNGNDHSPWRKLEDAVLALRIEHRHSKEQILASYLDTAYFGDGSVGVDAASKRYFGRNASTLDLARASLLAGLIQGPSAYDLTLHPRAARNRQVDVLRAMVRNGDITVAEGSAVLGRPLPVVGSAALPALANVRLAPGPAFVWSDVVAGSAALVAGATMLALRRRLGRRPLPALVALVLVGAGLLAVARSFRTL